MAGKKYNVPGLEALPELTDEMLERVYGGLGGYLFMTVIKKGERRFYCPSCGKTFFEGVNADRRTITPEDRQLDYVRHLQQTVCPKCHKSATVINTKVQKEKSNTFISESVPIAFFYALGYDDVWVRCAFVNRDFNYNGRHCRKDINEAAVYHFTPSGARHWKKDFGYFGWGELSETDKPFEPFTWSYSLAHEEYKYSVRCVTELNLNDTFLKYSGWDEFCRARPNGKIMKYFSWYCRHPQLELLAKFGFYDATENMLDFNADYPMFINWNAKKPWELFKLNRPQYGEWKKRWISNLRGRAFEILKAYKRLKLSEPRDFETVEKIWDFAYCNNKEMLLITRYIRRYNKTPRQAVAYFEKIAAGSAGACHMCVGITARQACSMWIDYIRMGDADGKKKGFSPYPANLKGAHDSFLTKQRLQEGKKAAARAKQAIEKNAEQVAQRYPKCQKNISEYSKKYEWSDGKLSFICPKNIKDILYDGTVLGQCTARPDSDGKNWRYFERINSNVKFIGFVRKADEPDVPWFTVEFEPGGRVLQKRAAGDEQPAGETEIVTEFLIRWQQAILPRLNAKDRRMATRSREIYSAELAELRKTGKKIYNGGLAGTLLVDALEKDLLEIESAS